MILDVSNTEDRRENVLRHLSESQYKRVIDVGGGMNLWAKPHITHTVDILPVSYGDIKSFSGDLNEPEVWSEVILDVEKHGKFDYAICTHVLEDVRNPVTILKNLPMIAKKGFIAVPNKHFELNKNIECCVPDEMGVWGVFDNWIGFFHHRWILDVKDGTLWLFPKLEFTSKIKALNWAKGRDAFHELSFTWENDIPWHIINNDFMGPTGYEFIQTYCKSLTP